MSHRSGRLHTSLMLAGAALLLSWPALHNGFPLLHWDSQAYITSAVDRLVYFARSYAYSAFLLLVHQERTLWPIVFVQGLIVAHVLYLVMRVVSGSVARVRFLGVVSCLAAFTSLSWRCATIMPDVFTAVVALGLFVLGLHRGLLNRGETIYLTLLTGAAITFHTSHVAIAAMVLVTLVAVGARAATLRAPTIAVVLGVISTMGVHVVDRRELTIAPNGSVFLLAKLLADGPARAYLRESCPDRGFRLCEHVDDLSGDHNVMLWDKSRSPFYRIGGLEAVGKEAPTIVRETLSRHPGWVLRSGLRSAGHQLLSFGIGHALPAFSADHPMPGTLRRIFPRSAPRFEASRQMRGRLSLGPMNATATVVVAASVIVSAILLVRQIRRRESLLLSLHVVIAVTVLGNAVVMGALSGVSPRYQNRVVWLLVFGALLSLLGEHASRTRHAGAGERSPG